MEELLQQFERRVNRQFLWGYRATAFILAILFALIACQRFLRAAPGAVPRFLVWEAVGLAAFFLVVFVFAGRVRTSGRHVEDLGVLLVLGAVLNSILLMVALPHAVQTTNFMLVQVGSGMAFRSRLRFVLVQLLNLMGWVALFLRVEAGSQPDHWIFAIASALFLAVAFHLFVQKTTRQLQAQFLQKGLILRQRERLIGSLRKSLANVRTLRGLIPICAHCKKVRDDEGYWHAVEHYLKEHSEAEFTHGICPQCAELVLREWKAGRG